MFLADLHTHSTASDGTLTPAELVARAAERGVTTLALTDHDTLDGVVTLSSQQLPIELIPGVELSATWKHQTVHIVGLQIDSSCAALTAGLVEHKSFRDWRAEEMCRRLAKRGMEHLFVPAQALVEGDIFCRTHLARALVERGLASSIGDAVRRFLLRGKAGYVPGQWADLTTAVEWIRGAGGVAILAHPLRYAITNSKRRQLLTDFVDSGGQGIEVVSGPAKPDQIRLMAREAQRLGLYASQGSDFHTPECRWSELGRFATLPEGCQPVWRSWNGEDSSSPVVERSA